MKERRHHNNKGYRQIKNGSTHKSLQYIIRKLNLNEGGSSNDDSRWAEEDKGVEEES